MSDDIEIFQINLHKAYSPTNELKLLLDRKTTFIALLQEPVARLGSIKGFSRRNCVLIHSGGQANPRAAICMSKNIAVHPLYNLYTTDQAVARLSIVRNGVAKDIIICSSYFPHDSTLAPPTDEFARVVAFCTQNNLPLISGVDCNAHHTVWGSTDVN